MYVLKHYLWFWKFGTSTAGLQVMKNNEPALGSLSIFLSWFHGGAKHANPGVQRFTGVKWYSDQRRNGRHISSALVHIETTITGWRVTKHPGLFNKTSHLDRMVRTTCQYWKLKSKNKKNKKDYHFVLKYMFLIPVKVCQCKQILIAIQQYTQIMDINRILDANLK